MTHCTRIEKICDSVLAAYSCQNDAWKRARFKPIREGIRSELELAVKHAATLVEVAERLADRRVKEQVLSLLQFDRFRRWNGSPIEELFHRAVMMAATDGDAAFFKALGERLKDKPTLFKPPIEPTALANQLIENWVTKDGICFCWFTDEALVAFLRATVVSVTLDALRKTRQRLKLLKPSKALIKRATRRGELVYLS